VNVLKGSDTCESEKRQLYMKKKGGSVDDRSLYTRSSNEQGPNDSKESLPLGQGPYSKFLQ